MTTLDTLITTTTRAGARRAAGGARRRGLPVTAWQSGNALRALAVADAEALRDLRSVVAGSPAAGTSTPRRARVVDAARREACSTPPRPGAVQHPRRDGDLRFGRGAVHHHPAQLVVSDGTRRWQSTNTTNVTVPSGGSAILRVRAEEPATHGTSRARPSPPSSPRPSRADGPGRRDRRRGRPRGVRCHPARPLPGPLGDARRGATLAAYEFWALSTPGAEAVRRVYVAPGPGDGTLAVYIAQAAATATGPQVAAVQSYIDTQCPVTDAPTVTAATEVPVAVTATVRVRTASDSAANRTAATDAIAALINGTGLGGEIDREAIAAAIYGASVPASSTWTPPCPPPT